MAMYTPKGRIIELPLEYGFTLLARLGDVSPVKVLRAADGIDEIPALLAVSAAIICFICHANPLQITVAVFVTSVIGSIITTFGLFLIPWLPAIATVYSRMTGWGVVYAVVSLIGLFIVGWKGVLAFLIGRTVALVAHFIFTVIKGKILIKRFGFGPIFSAEINFLHAYQLYAVAEGKPTDICVTTEELDNGNWRNCIVRLREEWPEGKIPVTWI